MINPFLEKSITDQTDKKLVRAAVQGNRKSLEELITRHQAWIYNIALRMVYNPEDAKDVAQEIMIKMITHLSSYQGKAAFRTWLYRILANHVITMKKREAEHQGLSFVSFGKSIDETPDLDLCDEDTFSIEKKLIIEETKIGCMQAMLLCLDRTQRLIFILGAVFGVSGCIGAEITGFSHENYRQRLCRARTQVANFMNDKCGLMNSQNPCHCVRKTKSLIDQGVVDPVNLQFSVPVVEKVRTRVPVKYEHFESLIEQRCRDLFTDQPFYHSPDFVSVIRELFDSDDFQQLFSLNN